MQYVTMLIRRYLGDRETEENAKYMVMLNYFFHIKYCFAIDKSSLI